MVSVWEEGGGGDVVYARATGMFVHVTRRAGEGEGVGGERTASIGTTDAFSPPVYVDGTVVVQMSSAQGVARAAKAFMRITDHGTGRSTLVDMTRRLYGASTVASERTGAAPMTNEERRDRWEGADEEEFVFNTIVEVVRDREGRWFAGRDQEGRCHFVGI